MEESSERSTKIKAMTENSTQNESAMDDMQRKWEFSKCTKLDQS